VGVCKIDPITPFTGYGDGLLSQQDTLQCRQRKWSIPYWQEPDGPYDDIGALGAHADAILGRVPGGQRQRVVAILPCLLRRSTAALLCWSNVKFVAEDTGTSKIMGAGGSTTFQRDFAQFVDVLRISHVAVATRAVAALLGQHPFYARFASMFVVLEPLSSDVPVAEVPTLLGGMRPHRVGTVWAADGDA
jgi:hypothetical protein